jgi:hypothetical protein
LNFGEVHLLIADYDIAVLAISISFCFRCAVIRMPDRILPILLAGIEPATTGL